MLEAAAPANKGRHTRPTRVQRARQTTMTRMQTLEPMMDFVIATEAEMKAKTLTCQNLRLATKVTEWTTCDSVTAMRRWR